MSPLRPSFEELASPRHRVPPETLAEIRRLRVVHRNRWRNRIYGIALGKPEKWLLRPSQEELEKGVIDCQVATVRPKYCPVRFNYEDYEL